MINRVAKLLDNKGENYIIPFFWQHGEEEPVLREYMGVINACGIRAVCVECRPHPDFCGPKWWHDMDIIMDEARKRGMRVWLLDDAHFPTGYANGALKEAGPSLRKQYLYFKTADVCGPMPGAALDVSSIAGSASAPFDGTQPVKVIASRLVKDGPLDTTLLDLNEHIRNGRLLWDVPDGMWRIFVLFCTVKGGGHPDYINIIDKDSCRVLIDAVYEPHYERYKDDFGKTFAGFFSDEPLFGNTSGYKFNEIIGKNNMPLPWNKDVPGMLKESLGDEWARLLPALWSDLSDRDLTAKVRYAYMDTVTRLAGENFSKQIGQWCETRGVEYIGHIIEDNNMHARLGSSLGHYFRALAGMHMSGIDNIGGQVVPGGENHIRTNGVTECDGEFFHFTLGKLGSSYAHIDPKKRCRAMCEIFGAYGWKLGVRGMKYLVDHFLVRGINYFVPHAFSPKEFPDPDCPPHFYARGYNPQYRHFQKLMQYLNRVCHLLNGGLHVAPAALLYHGEAEWTGNCMLLQKPARKLLKHQIDFDILPSDLFDDMNAYKASFDGRLHVNGETYQTLIIPYAQYVTKAVALFASEAAKTGFEVIFIDALPDGISNCANKEENRSLSAGLKACTVVPLCGLADYLERKSYREVKISSPFERLRYYRYRHENDIYLFLNEDPGIAFEGDITVPSAGNTVLYDAYENVLRPLDFEPVEGGTRLRLRLEPFQLAIVVFGDVRSGAKLPSPAGKKTVIGREWTLSLAKSKEYPNFTNEHKITKLENVGLRYPDFSGFMRYETTFEIKTGKTAVLVLEDAYEGVEVWVNGQNAGIQIAPPYRFDISGLVRDGVNRLRIEVANTLDREVRTMPVEGVHAKGTGIIEPSGLIGEVSVWVK
jgi:hypothetical protein